MRELDKILGNESIKNYFHSAMAHKMISHAYILEGEKGSGKKLMTSVFAKMLQCEAGSVESVESAGVAGGTGNQIPCGKCTSCIQMENRNHPDVIWVEHEKPGVISVKEIREQVVNTVDVKPYRGPYKIYIIDEAEKMNNAAQNAILKTIEEPAEYAIIFLLTSNRGAFLPTILSRCIIMGVKPVRNDQVCQYLMKEQGIDRGMAEFYAGFSMGNLGRAIAISSSEEFQEMREATVHLLREIHQMESNELDAMAKASKAYKDHIADYFDLMRMWFRDLLIMKTTMETSRIIFQTETVALGKQVRLLPLEAIDKIFQKIMETEQQIRFNVNFEAAMLLMLLEIRKMFRS